MLQLIEGGSGSGKSALIRENILRLVSGGASVLFLVPEQFSFETEREYYESLGAALAPNLRVLSFNRLATEVFRTYGGLCGEYASDTAKILTMRLALKACRENLTLYRTNAAQTEFTLSMVSAVEEFKHAGMLATDLEDAALTCESPLLAEKLSDLSLIAGSYEALLGVQYRDSADDLSRAMALIEKHGFFQNTHLFLDEFKSFTAVQEQILACAFREAASITASLCIPHNRTEYGLFDGIRETERKLKGLARGENRLVAAPIRLTEFPRFQNLALAHFSAQILNSNPTPFTGENQAVHCIGLHNEFDEAEFAASTIWELVSGKGLRFREIAVIGRDLDLYSHILEAAFDRYQIPYFLDRAETVDTMPLFRFLAHLLKLTMKLEREELLAMLKCGLLPVSIEEIAAFEDYTYIWNKNKLDFLSPFAQNPAGFTDRRPGEREEMTLATVNKVREMAVNLVERLKTLANEENSVGKALYTVLTEAGIQKQIVFRIHNLKNAGRQTDADHEKRAWEVLVELLDTMTIAVEAQTTEESQRVNFREYRELFLLAAATYPLNERPQTLDSVLIGSAERVRLSEVKAVLAVGCNDRIFPLAPQPGGLLTDRDRNALVEMGLPVRNRMEERLIEERFVAYKALTAPSDFLYISYAQGDVSGRERLPSEIVTGYGKIFLDMPPLLQNQLSPAYFCRSLPTAFFRYARTRGKADQTETAVFAETLRTILEKRPLYQDKLQRLTDAVRRDRFLLKNEWLARELFAGKPLMVQRKQPEALRFVLQAPRLLGRWRVREQGKLRTAGRRVAVLSPSRIEKFFNCRFQYFCRYGLSLYPRMTAELNPLSRGNVIHHLLDRILKTGDFPGMSSEALKDMVERYLLEYLLQVMGGAADKTARFLYFYSRLARTVLGIFEALKAEFSQMDFTVVGLEEAVGGRHIKPLMIPVDEKDFVAVTGKIDRVDAYSLDGTQYIRVVDYKSGSRKFDLSSMAAGLNLQMLIYLFAIWRSGSEKYKNARPAGVLYMPAGNPKPTLGRDAGVSAQEKAFGEAYRMNGLLLEDNMVLKAMERNLEGRFLPVSQGKTGIKGKTLATESQFLRLEEHLTGLVREMGQELFQGQIAPDPVLQTQGSACSYCDYQAICGQEDKKGMRTIPKVEMEDICNDKTGVGESAPTVVE